MFGALNVKTQLRQMYMSVPAIVPTLGNVLSVEQMTGKNNRKGNNV